MAVQHQNYVSRMLLDFASWLQEGCHGTSQQVHTGARKKGQEAVPAASVSMCLFFFNEHTSFLKTPASGRLPFVSVAEWLIHPDFWLPFTSLP